MMHHHSMLAVRSVVKHDGRVQGNPRMPAPEGTQSGWE